MQNYFLIFWIPVRDQDEDLRYHETIDLKTVMFNGLIYFGKMFGRISKCNTFIDKKASQQSGDNKNTE